MFITDTITGREAIIHDASDIADTITPWYPEAPAEVTDAIRDLQTAVMRGEYTGGLEESLALRIER